MSTGVSFLPDTYPICYNKAVDMSPARSLEQLEKENEDLKKENVELRKEIARLRATTPTRPPRAQHATTTRGWTPSTADPSPEKPFMRATRASKIREMASKSHAFETDSNKNRSPSFTKSHFGGQGNHHYRPPSPHNSTPSRRSSEPRYMQPTTASVQRKGSSSSTAATTPTPPKAHRQEPMPKFQMTRQVKAVRPVQQMQQSQANGNGNGSKSRNKTRQSTPGSSSLTSAGNKGLDDSLWQAMQARSERPVPIPRRTDSQVSAVVEQDQTAAAEVATPVGSGMLNGSKSSGESSASSPMASDV